MVARCPFDYLRDYSVVAGSPPLNAFITVSIPDVMNIKNNSDCRVQISDGKLSPATLNRFIAA